MNDAELPPDVIRPAYEIARRALVVSSVVAVAHGHPREKINAWLQHEKLWPDLSPREQMFLSTGHPLEEERIAFTWWVERLAPLLWSIKKIATMPPLDRQWATEGIRTLLPWPPEPSHSFIRSAVVRPEQEIHEEYEKIYQAHWRVRDAQLKNQPPPNGLSGEAIYERHYGFNWLTGYCSQEWDEISTDT